MGLVGGPHCVAMCAAPCHAVAIGHARAVPWTSAAHMATPPQLPAPVAAWWSTAQFHLGRLLGYGLLGALAAGAMSHMAWWADRTSALYSIWMGMHLLVLAWGLLLLMQGQQPLWLEHLGRTVWARVQPVMQLKGGATLAGMAWALMPCGLLYSAILVAALAGNIWAGVGSMIGFAAGSAVWLLIAPYAWRWLAGRMTQWRSQWGTRAAGGMLVAVALWAIWMDLVVKPALWCR